MVVRVCGRVRACLRARPNPHNLRVHVYVTTSLNCGAAVGVFIAIVDDV